MNNQFCILYIMVWLSLKQLTLIPFLIILFSEGCVFRDYTNSQEGMFSYYIVYKYRGGKWEVEKQGYNPSRGGRGAW